MGRVVVVVVVDGVFFCCYAGHVVDSHSLLVFLSLSWILARGG